MQIFLPIIIIMILSITISFVCKRRLAEVFPVCIMGIMFILYLFYCMNLLHYGWILVVASAFIALLYLIQKMVHCRDNFEKVKNKILQPEILVWMGALVLIAFVTRNNKVSLWDELRLWGVYPKILFYTESLQLGEESLLFEGMDAYFPGMPLLSYFFLKFGIEFRESPIFFAYGTYAVSILVSSVGEIKKNYWGYFPLGVLIIYLIPTLCYNSSFDSANFYYSLFVDPILGITIGYMIFLISQGINNDTFSLVKFIFTLTTVILLKESGISFALIGLAGAILSDIFVKNKVQWLKMLSVFVACLSTWGIWKGLCHHFNVHNPTNFDINAILDLSFVKEFVLEAVRAPVVNSNYLPENFTSFIFIYLLLTMVIVGAILIVQKGKQYNYASSFLILHVSNAFFIVGIYIVYVGAFNKRILSFPRYVCTVLMALIVFLWLFVTKEYKEMCLQSSVRKILFSLILIAFFIIFPYHSANEYESGKIVVQTANQHAKLLLEEISKIEKPERHKIFLICDGYNQYTLLHHRMYYELAGTGYQIENFVDYTVLGDAERDNEAVLLAQEEFLRYLKEKACEYVYVATTDDIFKTQFGELFDQDVAEDTLWKFSENSGQDKLILVAR